MAIVFYTNWKLLGSSIYPLLSSLYLFCSILPSFLLLNMQAKYFIMALVLLFMIIKNYTFYNYDFWQHTDKTWKIGTIVFYRA